MRTERDNSVVATDGHRPAEAKPAFRFTTNPQIRDLVRSLQYKPAHLDRIADEIVNQEARKRSYAHVSNAKGAFLEAYMRYMLGLFDPTGKIIDTSPIKPGTQAGKYKYTELNGRRIIIDRHTRQQVAEYDQLLVVKTKPVLPVIIEVGSSVKEKISEISEEADGSNNRSHIDPLRTFFEAERLGYLLASVKGPPTARDKSKVKLLKNGIHLVHLPITAAGAHHYGEKLQKESCRAKVVYARLTA